MSQLPCDAELTIERDTTICLPADPVQLIASFDGEDIFDINWTPTTGLSSTSSLTPTANVTATTTYTLTVSYEVGDNLVFNGDFALGNTGFTTEYDPSPTTLWPESVYAITDNPNALHPNFNNCGDITGEGNVMAVNGAGNPGTEVWCQTIDVSPGTEYNFSAWLANLIAESPAILQFSADGDLLGPPFSVPGVCVWDQFNATWNSGTATSVELCIVNQNTAISGNDFAIDDIRFRQVCERDAEVTITVLEEVTSETFVTICPEETYFAGGSEQNESGVYLDYYTAVNGCDSIHTTHLTVLPEIPTTLIDTVICAGDILIYEGADLTETGVYPFPFTSINGCDSTVVIDLEVIDFNVGISEPDILNCIQSNTSIELFITPERDDLTIFWSTTDGNIVEGFTENVAVVDAPGTYTVEVFYENGNVVCGYFTHDITVLQDIALPAIDMFANGELNCNNPTVVLDASGSAGGDVYQWEVLSGGDIIDGEGTDLITINGPGEYQLTLTNSENGCEDVHTITIAGDPGGNNEVIIDSILPFTCERDTTTIPAGASIVEGGFGYYWYTEDGEIVDGEFSLEPTVTNVGWYYLVIEENSGTCADTTAIWVGEYLDSLDMEIVSLDTITCSQNSAEVTISIIGDDPYSTVWTDRSGVTMPSTNGGLTVSSSGVDTLTLMLTNEASGCVTYFDIIIPEDRQQPIVNMGPDTSINCNIDTLTINSVSPVEDQYSYNWSTSEGEIADGQNEAIPSITLPGWYHLLVVDTANGCITEDSIFVENDRIVPVIDIQMPAVLTCALDTVPLYGSATSTTGTVAFIWTDESGNILPGGEEESVFVTAPGTYHLSVIDDENGCQSDTSITVDQDIVSPVADAGDGFTLNCLIETFTLDAEGSSQGNIFQYDWSTEDGSFTSETNAITATINAAGSYILTVLNTENGCTATDTVEVLNDAGAPEITLADVGILNCRDSFVEINASGSTSGSNIDVIWQTTDGNISDFISAYIIEVDEAGTYNLELINQDNECRSVLSITVMEDRVAPDVPELPLLTLTCEQNSVSPDLQGVSEGDEFSYQWNSSGGQDIEGEETLSPIFRETGSYTLSVHNAVNFCETTGVLIVDIDTTAPFVNISEPDTLTCAEDFIVLDGSLSDHGVGFKFEWTTVDGQINGSTTSPSINVAMGGTYELLVTNTNNGCSSNQSIAVIEDRDLPEISLLPPDQLSCAVEQVSLSSEGSSTGDEIDYLWSTNDGQIINSPTAETVQVAETGWYQLVITNVLSGCSIADSILVIGDYEEPEVIAGPDEQFNCATSVIPLNGQANTNGQPFEANWTTVNGRIDTNPNQLDIIASASGIYLLSVTNLTNGCTSSDELTILPDDNDIEAVDAEIIQPDCDRSFGIFDLMDISGGTPPFDYTLSDSNGQTWNVDEIPPGQYVFEINDQVGCDYTIEFDIIGLEPITVDIEPLITIELGDSVTLQPIFNLSEDVIETVVWNPGTYLICIDCLMPNAFPPDHMQYTIQVFDDNGCQARATTQIRVIRTGGVYAPNAFTPGNNDGNNDYFTIYSKPGVVEEVELLEVFDRWGNRVFSKTQFQPDINEEGWDGTFLGQAVNPGIYVYRAEVRLTNGYLLKLHGEVNVFN